MRPRDGGQQGCAAREQNRGCYGVSRHLRCVSRDRCDLVVPRHEQFVLFAATRGTSTTEMADSSLLAFLASKAFSKQSGHDLCGVRMTRRGHWEMARTTAGPSFVDIPAHRAASAEDARGNYDVGYAAAARYNPSNS